jgi:hypothetical protein
MDEGELQEIDAKDIDYLVLYPDFSPERTWWEKVEKTHFRSASSRVNLSLA